MTKCKSDNRTLEISESKQIEIEAIKLAEGSLGDICSLNDALNLINKAISIEATLPETNVCSMLNNKAQILRLLKRNEEALECLNQVLDDESNKSITNNILKNASAQRGWIHFRSGNLEAALKDFQMASQLGCLESKRMSIKCNPYAAMCNQMMQELIGSQFYSKSQ